ncbi:hypothetical protein FGO68_gene8930 [Halteria grandinella]|uniref:Uncharacterized protein n=1 Tax=Halteria grandinella TaxID=5974 RepID=A0A8J8NHP0_HALGN|nr:hypothetical protein FGO68_gene8930 [Halteria grandinella]
MAHPFSNPLPDCSSSSYHNVYEQASSSDKAEVDLHSYSDINQRLFQAKTKLCLQEIAALFTINEGFIKLIKDHLLRSTAMRRFRTISSEDDPAYQIRENNMAGSSMENQIEDINRFETISGQYQESILGLGDIYDGRSKAKVSYYKLKDGLALSPRLRATSSINPLLKKNGGRISLPLAWNAKRSQSNRYLSPDNLSKEKKLADLMGIPEIKGLPEKSEPEGNGGGGGKPQILKKLISQRKLLNTTKKALGDTLLPDGSSQNAPSEIDSKEFRIHVYPNPTITTQSHIPSKFKPKLNQEPKKPANQCQPQRRLQDLLLNDSPNKVGQNKGEREMRAALKFLRRLGQTLREKSPNRSPTGHTPGGLTGQDRNTPRAGDETSNSSRQYPQSFGDVVTGQELLKQALENSSRCEDIIRQDKSEHVSPTDRNPAVQTSLEEGQENLSMLNEGVKPYQS